MALISQQRIDVMDNYQHQVIFHLKQLKFMVGIIAVALVCILLLLADFLL